MVKINVTDKILEVSTLLDEIDEYDNSSSSALSIADSKICDLMHLIEMNTLKTNQCYRIVRELHKLRLERRKIKNDMDLLQVFKTEKNKLINMSEKEKITLLASDGMLIKRPLFLSEKGILIGFQQDEWQKLLVI